MARFSVSYKIISHEYVDDKLVRVNFRCLGYPVFGRQPDAWPFSIKVPLGEQVAWPLGALVSLEIG